MPVKKRTYNTRLVKTNYCYMLIEIAELFGVHLSSVRKWLKEGLPLIDTSRPYMVHGSDLIAFLKKRQADRKRPCKKHEFYCLKCRAPRTSCNGNVEMNIKCPKRVHLSGKCSACDTAIFKAGSVKNIAEYTDLFSIQKIQGRHIIERSHPTLMYHFERTIKK